jgi:predicted 3-demethylubiquinone-9 3-methyltransferase (glyoxalase superfamily)
VVISVNFSIEGQEFIALNGGPHFKFNEAFSIFVSCADQAEVDYCWERLTADGGEESMCGWLKDKFGLSWQIVPEKLMELIGNPDAEKAQRATQAMLKMHKIELGEIQRAFEGE